MNIKKIITAFLFTFVFGLSTQTQALLIDNSPDTTGVSTVVSNFANIFGVQYLGDTFTLGSGNIITGGSIFSHSIVGAVGDSVRFVILPDVTGAPGSTPIIDIITTLDMVDTLLTTSDASMTRKHASITGQYLAAGTYWFYMAGNGGVEIGVGTGVYDDNSFYAGFDSNPDLEAAFVSQGDVFFTIDGSVPEPATLALMGLGLAGLGFTRRKKA